MKRKLQTKRPVNKVRIISDTAPPSSLGDDVTSSHRSLRFDSRRRVGGRVSKERAADAPSSPSKSSSPHKSSHPPFFEPDLDWVSSFAVAEGFCQTDDSGEQGCLPTADAKKRQVQQVECLVQWQEYKREYLNEFLRQDAPFDAHKCKTPGCSNQGPYYRCKDCLGATLHCQHCLLKLHETLPLHRIQKWNGNFFEKVALCSLSLRVQLGHPGEQCPHLEKDGTPIVVVDLSGVHEVLINWCNCANVPRRIQLLRMKWFPATVDRPRTVMTFDTIKFFHLLSWQAKTTMYDFYETLLKRIDNSGLGRHYDRYRECSRIFREWRSLKLALWSGLAHTGDGLKDAAEGSCAVECPACPHPDKNLPTNWANCSAEKQFLYTLRLSMDANFRLKLKDRRINDILMDSGLSYFVEDMKFKGYIATCSNPVEINTCGSRLKAVDHANSRYSKGYVATGVGVVVCARHTFIRRSGACNLQKGERLMQLMIIYDIACQWCRNMKKRFEDPSQPFKIEPTIDIVCAIPKGHIRSHGISCQSSFSLNYLPGSGRTDGEGVERDWAHMNGLVASTREMGAGNREETLNDHWGSWNWQKLIKLGVHFAGKFQIAVKEYSKQSAMFQELVGTLTHDMVVAWNKAIIQWETDKRSEDPYQEGKNEYTTLADVRAMLAIKETTGGNRASGDAFPHGISPSAFLLAGIDLEEQQRNLRCYIRKIGREKETGVKVAEIQRRRNALKKKLDDWFILQAAYMPVVAAKIRAVGSDAEDGNDGNIQPEDMLMYLPSQIPDVSWEVGYEPTLKENERLLRLGEAGDALHDLKQQLTVYGGLVMYKIEHVGPGQKGATRARALLCRFYEQAQRFANRYRAAYQSLTVLDPDGEWTEFFKPLSDGDIKAPNGTSPEDFLDDPNISQKKKNKYTTGTGEGFRTLSWIWRSRAWAWNGNQSVTSDATHVSEEVVLNDAQFQNCLRVEYARSKARVQRWKEEIELLEEEMRRTVQFLRWKAAEWDSITTGARACKSPSDDTEQLKLAQGIAANGCRHASQLRDLADQFVSIWEAILIKNGKKCQWGIVGSYKSARTLAARPIARSSIGGDGNLGTIFNHRTDEEFESVVENDWIDDLQNDLETEFRLQ